MNCLADLPGDSMRCSIGVSNLFERPIAGGSEDLNLYLKVSNLCFFHQPKRLRSVGLSWMPEKRLKPCAAKFQTLRDEVSNFLKLEMNGIRAGAKGFNLCTTKFQPSRTKFQTSPKMQMNGIRAGAKGFQLCAKKFQPCLPKFQP